MILFLISRYFLKKLPDILVEQILSIGRMNHKVRLQFHF